MREENRGARVWQRRAKFYFAGWEFLLANSKSVRTDRILFYAVQFSFTHFLLFAALSDPTFIVNFDSLLIKKILHNFHFVKYCIKILLILISIFYVTNISPVSWVHQFFICLFVFGHRTGDLSSPTRHWTQVLSSTTREFSAYACVLRPFSHVRLFATLWTVIHQVAPYFPGKNTGVSCRVLL